MANLSNINNKFLVTTGGNVGIEVTGPTKKLDVYQSSVGFGVADFRHVNGNRILVNPSYNYYDAYNHIFRGLNGTDTHLTIDNSGNSTFAGNIILNQSNNGSGKIILTPDASSHYITANSYWIDVIGNQFEVFRVFGGVGGTTEFMRINGSGNTTFAAGVTAVTGKFSDNLYCSGGQVYFGALNGTTDNTYRMYVSSGQLITQSRESGTWTNRLVINDDGSVYTPNLLEAAGGLAAGDGIVGAPGFKFATDPHTGMYRISNDVIGFSTGGSTALTLGNNDATFAGNVTVNGGQILSPGGVNIALNPNTGIVSVGGSIQCTGAGASTFNGALLLNKSDGTYISLNHNNSLKGYLGIANQVITGGSASDIGLTANNDLVFGSGGTAARMYIKSDGKIGLGKSSPYYPIDATEIGANSHAWGSSGATFGQDHYQIRELNNLLWNAYDRFKDYGSSSNLTYQMFDGNFDSATALPTNSTHVIEIDFSIQGGLTYPQGYTVISFYYVYNEFTSVSGEQYHVAGTYAGQWRAMGTPVDIRGSAGSGTRVVKIPGAGNNYVGKFRYTFVTGSASVNVSDICYMTSRPAGYPISAYMRGDRNNDWFRNIYFKNSAFTTIGSIIPGGFSTAYNTSSDYRLKENVVEMTGALDRVSQLKPSRFNFISDADKTVDGFLAHEVQEIIPEAITGEKDAVDEQGNPKFQAIDQSKLVPLLVAAIQELKSEIDELKK